jgi:uncharacterized protein YjgD (DUF1641 family)
MKDYLEGLEIKEGQSKLTSEQIKGILAENGKIVKNEQEKVAQNNKEEIESYKSTIAKLESQIKDMPSSDEIDKLKNEIKAFKDAEAERIAKEEAEKEDEILKNNILTSIGDKKFTSDYVKNGILADVKAELKKQENIGKGIDKIVEELTKDKEGIFVNPNTNPGIPPMGAEDSKETKKETPILW